MMDAAIVGYGTLGRAIHRVLAQSSAARLSVVVDCAPALVGVPAVADLGPPGPAIVAALPPATVPTVLFHATGSDPDAVTHEILAAVRSGYHVISAAEWLFHPWMRYAERADEIDRAARAAGVTVLGCGINPGFCFESLPVLIARTIGRIDSVEILRVSDVSGIGPSDFAHLGFGLTPDQFAAGVLDGHIVGHMGFPESVAALGECVGLSIDAISDRLAPIPAGAPIQLAHRLVAAGEVAGLVQTAIGYRDDATPIRMVLEMYLDPVSAGRTPCERVRLAGSRTVQVSVEPGSPAVAGAAAMMVEAAHAVAACAPAAGLISLFDLPAGGGRLTRHLKAVAEQRDGSGTRIDLAAVPFAEL